MTGIARMPIRQTDTGRSFSGLRNACPDRDRPTRLGVKVMHVFTLVLATAAIVAAMATADDRCGRPPQATTPCALTCMLAFHPR